MSLTEKQRWELIQEYYKEVGLVRHHIRSYDDFVNNQLETILSAHVIEIPPEKNPKAYKSYRVYFSDPNVGMASHAQDGELRNENYNPMYPMEARRKGFSIPCCSLRYE